MWGLENSHTFLEWGREKEIAIEFVGEAWIEKNGEGIQTQLSFVLLSRAKKRRKVIAYTRKGMEKEVEVLKEEDNYIILQEKNKKKRRGVYTNGRWDREKWKEWLRSLEEEMGCEGSILEDWNARTHSRYETREEDTRGKIMEEWMVAGGWTVMECDSGLT